MSERSKIIDDIEHHEMYLVHQATDEFEGKRTKITIDQSKSNKLSKRVTCNHCEEEVDIRVKSSGSIRFRYVMVLLPSLVLGTYFIVSRAINEGLDTLILSLVLYSLFGFIGYLVLMTKLFNSFLSMVTTGSNSHIVQP